MPSLSLVICVHQERELLQRLLKESAGLYDDLVIVHDGPDTAGIRSVAESAGGRFFERELARQQEPHWPFAWSEAAHDWILRLDTDEFPSPELAAWLQDFRASPEPPPPTAGFTCIWPLWNGRKTVSRKWPADRIFLFQRNRVRFFGMAEQVPVPDGSFQPLNLILHHQPARKSYGFRNVLFRRQAYHWREQIARALLSEPVALPCWRWDEKPWPREWQEIRAHPLLTAVRRISWDTLRALRSQWRAERRFFPGAALNGSINHALIALAFWRLSKKGRHQPAAHPAHTRS